MLCAVAANLLVVAQHPAVQAPLTSALPSLAKPPRCGLNVVDGTLWAAGSGYRAAFRDGGVEFTPALGVQASRAFPLTLTVTGIGRGDLVTKAGSVAAVHDGLDVRFARPECVERYRVDGDGLAQSFTFAQLPAGDGDLLVRLACTTDLPLVRADATGLRFEAAGLGGVHIGAVTGVDAAGRRAAGTIAWRDGAIELRLPSTFVDHAALPLVLDPQIGPVFPVITSALDYQNPDIALLQGAGEFLCVFERTISANDRDLRAFRLDDSGAALGTLMVIAAGTTDDHDATVGSVRLANAYVVAYERGGDILARAVLPNGTVGAEVIVAMGSDNQVAPDLGSESTSVDDDGVIVWHNSTQARVQAAQLTPSAFGTLSVFGQVDLAAGTPGLILLGAPRIAHDDGGDGRFLIVYPRTVVGADTGTQALLVDRNLNTLAAVPLANPFGDDHDSADVCGDGDHWVVVFESEPNEGSGDNRIIAQPLYWRSQTGQLQDLGGRIVTDLPGVDEIDPVVSMLESSCVVAWRRRAAPGSSDTDVFCKTIDLFGCAECEPTVLLANGLSVETNLAAASLITGFRALVVWESDTAGNGDIAGIAWQAADGHSAAYAIGACGNVGRLAVGCSRVGNANHSIWLLDSSAGYISFLVLSGSTASISCGQCTLVPDPYAGFVSNVVSGFGNSSFELPIPNIGSLSGAMFAAQWIVSAGAGQCSFLNASFSDARAIYIE